MYNARFREQIKELYLIIYLCAYLSPSLSLSVTLVLSVCMCALLTMSRKQQCDIACNISMYRGNNFPRHHIAFKRSNFLLIYLRKRIHFAFCVNRCLFLISYSFTLSLPQSQYSFNFDFDSIPFKLWFLAYNSFDAERILLSINSYLTKIKLKSHGRKIIDYNAKRETMTKKKEEIID